MAKPVQLFGYNTLCGSNVDVSAHLRGMAESVDSGEWGEVRTVVMLVEEMDGKVSRMVFGSPTDTTRFAGLLFTEATRIANG